MFFTGFSSPFISVFLAVVLPWLIIMLGKNTNQPVHTESEKIIQVSQANTPKENFQNNYQYKGTQKPSIQKSSLFTGVSCDQFVFRDDWPCYGQPVDELIPEFARYRKSGSRAPPSMFT